MLLWFAFLPYITVLLYCSFLNRKEKKQQQNWTFSGSLPKVSLLIAFRNENLRIQPLLDSIAALDYPKEKLEIIMTDDHSDDNTAGRIRDFAAYKQLNIQVCSLPEGQTGKKAGIALARKKADSDYLFFTDADATLPERWLVNMLSCLQNTGASMVCSEVEVVYRKGLLNLFEVLEQAALVAFSASVVARGKVFLCNGAGYLVKKEALEKLVFPEEWKRAPGGDDVMLLHAMHRAKEKIAYCRIEKSRVQLEPAGAKEFLQQRIRWGSKVFLRNTSGNLVPALLVWLFHLVNMSLFGFLILKAGLAGLLMSLPAIFFLRGIWESLLLQDFITPAPLISSPQKKLRQPASGNLSDFMKLSALASALAPWYSLYTVLAGPLLLLTRNFTWKGRNYKSRSSPPIC